MTTSQPAIRSYLDLAKALDANPAALTESQWQYLRHRAATRDRPEVQALIEAAYAEPRLRRFYPYTSHFTLRFSTSTRVHPDRDVPVCVDPGPDGYRVTAGWVGEVLGRTATAQEAVTLAVRHLPERLDRVSYGGPPQRRRA